MSTAKTRPSYLPELFFDLVFIFAVSHPSRGGNERTGVTESTGSIPTVLSIAARHSLGESGSICSGGFAASLGRPTPAF
jgi:hypothetical protein